MNREDLLKLLARDRNTAGYSRLGQYLSKHCWASLQVPFTYVGNFAIIIFHKLHVFGRTVNHGELKKTESTTNTNIRESHNSRYKNNEYLCID